MFRKNVAIMVTAVSLITAVPFNVYGSDIDVSDNEIVIDNLEDDYVIEEDFVVEENTADIVDVEDVSEYSDEKLVEDDLNEENSIEALEGSTDVEDENLNDESGNIDEQDLPLSQNGIDSTDEELICEDDLVIDEESSTEELTQSANNLADAIEEIYQQTEVESLLDGNIVANSSKSYSVSPRNEVYFTAYNDNGSKRTIGKLEFASTVDATVAKIQPDAEHVQKLCVYEMASQKTLKVRVYDTDSEKVLDTITIKVLPIISKVTVSGVKSVKIDGVNVPAMKQAQGTNISYKVTKDKSASKDEIVLSVNGIATDAYDFDGGSAVLDAAGSKLSISTNDRASGNAVITIYNKNADYKKVAEFTLIMTEPSWVTKSPSVKVSSVTDTTLNLAMALPKGVDANSNIGSYFYRIEATPVIPTEGAIDNNVQYVSAVENAYALKVLNYEKGHGDSAKFKVETKLVLVDRANLPENPSVSDFEANTICVSKISTIKNAATKVPAYEKKLSLAKKTTKLYTGQDYVIVAVPSFSSSTTFREGLSVNSIKNVSGVNLLNQELKAYVDANNNIWVRPYVETESGKVNCGTGKYTVKVSYSRGAGQQVLTASFQINVVKAITNIDIQSPVKIYRAAGKKVTFKPTAVLNAGHEKPAVKKVLWSLDPACGPAKRGVTINKSNGMVTIPKTYRPSTDIEENKIRIIATANDFAGNQIVCDTAEVQIVSVATVIKKVVLKSITSEMVVADGDTVKVSDHFEIKAYADDNKTILVDNELYEVKLSGSLAYADDGYVYFTKAGKGTVTVTANDGAKSSAKMSATAQYANERLSIGIINSDNLPSTPEEREAKVKEWFYGFETTQGTYNYDNYHSANEAIEVSIYQIEHLNNVTISLSGGQVIYKNSFGIKFVPTAETSVVTVDNKGKGEKYTFKLKNHALKSSQPALHVYNLDSSLAAGAKNWGTNRPSVTFTAYDLEPSTTYSAVVSFVDSEYHPVIGNPSKMITSNGYYVIKDIDFTSSVDGDGAMKIYLTGEGEYTTNLTNGSYRIDIQLFKETTIDGVKVKVPVTKSTPKLIEVD